MAETTYRYLEVQPLGVRTCAVRLPRMRLDENELFQLSEELLTLIRSGRPRLALALGPEPPLYLFSVFLARLVTAQRIAHENGGEVKLCYCDDEVLDIFAACKFDTLFQFLPDFATAVAEWQE